VRVERAFGVAGLGGDVADGRALEPPGGYAGLRRERRERLEEIVEEGSQRVVVRGRRLGSRIGGR